MHGGSGGVKSREVNGRLVLEGVLRLYWGVHSAIQLKEDDDQRLPSNIESKSAIQTDCEVEKDVLSLKNSKISFSYFC